MYFTKISPQCVTGTSFVLIIFGSAGLYVNQLPDEYTATVSGVPESNDSVAVVAPYTLNNSSADSKPAPSLSDIKTLDCQDLRAWMEEGKRPSSELPFLLLRRLQMILGAACPDLMVLSFLPEVKSFSPHVPGAEIQADTMVESKFYSLDSEAENKFYAPDLKVESKLHASDFRAEGELHTPDTGGDVTDLSRGGFLVRARRSLPAAPPCIPGPHFRWVQAGDSFTILTGVLSLLAVVVYQIAVRITFLLITIITLHYFQPSSDITYASVVTLLVLSMSSDLLTSELSVTTGSSSLLTLHAASLASFFKLIKSRYCVGIIKFSSRTTEPSSYKFKF